MNATSNIYKEFERNMQMCFVEMHYVREKGWKLGITK